ncbi:MAG: DoxX family protein [Pseudomonadota bacterium]
MSTLVTVAQVVVALVILNVWLMRPQKATAWRGGSAATMPEEFAVYGLPRWLMFAVGALKLTLAALLIAGVWVPRFTQPAALGLGALMLAAVIMHIKAGDPPRKSLPALTLLALCALIAAS